MESRDLALWVLRGLLTDLTSPSRGPWTGAGCPDMLYNLPDTERGSSWPTSIFLLPVYPQVPAYATCGYHALHNLVSVLNDDSSVSSPAAFHSRFARFKSILYASITDKAERAYLHHDALERFHAPLLIEKIGMKSSITVFPEISVDVLDELKEAFDKFQPKRCIGGPVRHGFLLGLLNHWIAVVVIRETWYSPCKLIVMDSLNRRNMLDSNSEVIMKEAAEIPDSEAWKRPVHIQSRLYAPKVLKVIRDCCDQKVDIRTYYIDDVMNHLLDTLNEYPRTVEGLNCWSRDLYPAPILRTILKRMHRVGAVHVSRELAARGRSWLEETGKMVGGESVSEGAETLVELVGSLVL